MIFAGLKLPRKLQRHVANLSSTVQVLLSEVILYAEGLEAEANLSTGAKLKSVMKAKKSTELIAEQLTSAIGETAEDMAIAVAAAAGRSTKEIAEFLSFEQAFVMRRLCAIRKTAEKEWKHRQEEPRAKGDGAIVLEIFAEAQRR